MLVLVTSHYKKNDIIKGWEDKIVNTTNNTKSITIPNNT